MTSALCMLSSVLSGNSVLKSTCLGGGDMWCTASFFLSSMNIMCTIKWNDESEKNKKILSLTGNHIVHN